MRAFWCLLTALLLVLASAHRVQAAPVVPAPLEPWRAWVLQDNQAQLCARLAGEAEPLCIWPSRLALRVGPRGGSFTLDVQVDAPGIVSLPGDAKLWPVQVKVDRNAAVVLARGELPTLHLESGRHVVTGEFAWTTLPESLPIPRTYGLLSLRNASGLVDVPNRDEHGVVWLQKSGDVASGDQLELTVHRKITDEVPVQLSTRITLQIAGKSREVLLGKVLPAEFLALSLDSPLPARLEPDGHLRVQVRPGTYTLALIARSRGPIQAITRPDPEGLWRDGDEVWAFDSRNDLRIVSLDGSPPIDPGQTSLPPEWRGLPAFAVSAGGTLAFHERQRGDASPGPDRLRVTRNLWLDFDGAGFTFRDMLSGELHRSWRLDIGPNVDLGRVSIGGRDVHITRIDPSARAGVEVRQGALTLQAEGRLLRNGSMIPAALWNSDFESAAVTLHLPPGWDLFHASGVDAVTDSWVHRWRLLEIFLALVLGAAFLRLFGLRWGLLALLAMITSLTVPDAPRWTWFAPLALDALVRMAGTRFGAGKLHAVVAGARVAALAALAIALVPFAIQQVRGGIYPALESVVGNDEYSFASIGARNADLKEQVNDVSVAAEPLEESAPMPTPAPAGKLADDAKPSALGGTSANGENVYKTQQFNTSEYDPNAVVQVGPGVPTWSWRTLGLVFNGPVQRDQSIRLWLLPPAARLPLALLRVALLALLFVRLLFSALPRFAPRLRAFAAGPTAVALLLCVGFAPNTAHAQTYPPRELLEDLKARLLQPPACADACADISRMWIDVGAARITIRLEVGALSPTAVQLPGRLTQWSPDAATLDDRIAPLRRSDDGGLLLDVPVGVHRVLLSGPVPTQASIPIDLPSKPRVADVTLSAGWTLDGVHEDGRIDDTLQLTRAAVEDGASSLLAGSLPSFVRVERTLHIGVNWQVETRVVRLSPLGTAIALEIPLLAGESVTTADIRVERGKVIAQLPRDASELTWHAALQEKSPIVLTAAKTLDWTEQWQLDVSPMWHADLSGLPVTHRQSGGILLPDWRPWPGEEARIDIRRPEGVGGQTLAIDASTMTVRPGLRSTDVELAFELRASRGGEHAIVLPEGCDLQEVALDGTAIPLRLEERTLTLPVRPGSVRVRVRWREPRGITTWYSPSRVDLRLASVNGTVHVELADDSRWVLFLRGPRLGPAVLFWSYAVVLLLVAYGLSREKRVPLKMWEWVLLGIGIAQTSPWAAAAFAGWLLALAWRGRNTALAGTPHRLVQSALIAWTVLALFVLLASIHQGLLGFPSMRIEGNGSSNSSLHWYLDRTPAELASPHVLSVPILAYRLMMLLWALWLALAVLRWVRWGFVSFVAGGAWKARAPRPVHVAAQVQAAPPVPPTDPAP